MVADTCFFSGFSVSEFVEHDASKLETAERLYSGQGRESEILFFIISFFFSRWKDGRQCEASDPHLVAPSLGMVKVRIHFSIHLFVSCFDNLPFQSLHICRRKLP